MNSPIQKSFQNNSVKMSSRDIARYTEKQHKHVIRDIKKLISELYGDGPELDDLKNTGLEIFDGIFVDIDVRGYVQYFLLDRKHTDCLLTGYSAQARMKVIQRWHELEEGSKKPLSQLEIIAHSALALVEHEKKLTALEQSHAELESKVQKLQESTSILPARPTNAENISYIRQRINKKYGLPARIVNDVLYSFPYAPKPAGQVRNSHENAGNATHTVWYSSDVTKLFNRFVAECVMATKTQAVHPLIDGRFKLLNEEIKFGGEAV